MKFTFFSAVYVCAALLGTGCKQYVDVIGADGSGGSGGSSNSGGSVGTTSTSSQDVPPESPTEIVVGKAGPLAVDDAWLFIGDSSASAPYRVAKAGGTPELVTTTAGIGDGSGVRLLAVDNTHVYWVVYNGNPGYQLWRAPKAGGAADLVTDTTGPNNAPPNAIVVDSDFVYLTLPDIYNAAGGPAEQKGVLLRVPKAGGPAQEIAQAYSLPIAVDDSFVYWAKAHLDGSGGVIRANKDGAGAQEIVSELGPVESIATAGDRLYWTFGDAGLFYLRSSASGSAPLTLATLEAYVGDTAAAEDAGYWLRGGDAKDGAVLRAKTDATVDEIAHAPASANYPFFYGAFGSRIVTDATAVYWSYEGAAGGVPRVFRVAR